MADPLQHVPILNIDVQGFTTHNEATQDTLTRRLQEMLTTVAQRFLPATDPWALWRRHGTGDGYYIVFVGYPPQIALQYALQLDASLVDYNAVHGQDLPMRLYAALVLGDVKLIGDQYRSAPFSEAARFLSHEPLKKYLQQQDRPMVLAMSALFHTEWREASRQSNPFPEAAALLWTRFVCRDKHGHEHPGYVRGPGWEQPQEAAPLAVQGHPGVGQPGPETLQNP